MEPLRAWVAAARGSAGYVLRGDQLGQARALLDKYKDELDAEERELVERSSAQALREQRRARALTVAAGMAALLMGVLTLFARWEWNEATNAESRANEAARQLALIEGPASTVSSAAFSPDGQRVVTASNDKTARVWNTADGRQLALLEGHEDKVWSAAFSADGQRVVTGSWDKTARVWNAADGRQLALLKGHVGRVWSATFSADGRRIVTASDDGTARVWSAADGRQLALLKGHVGKVWSATFSADGQRIVTASHDKTARVWAIAGPTLRKVLAEVTTASPSPEMRETHLIESPAM
jgi:WD40 repeat protein